MVDDYAAGHLQRVAGAIGSNKGIAIAIAANPRTKRKHASKFALWHFETEDLTKGIGHLAIDAGQRVKQSHWIGIEAHANFVGHAGFAEAHFVGLPQSCDLGDDLLLQILRIGNREW